MIKIRTALESDAKELLEIYAPYIEKTVITFEYTVPTLAEFSQRIHDTLKQYPYIVAEDNGEIVGYAYVGPFNVRAAYDWTVESSVYVKSDVKGKGIGTKLYQALEDILKKQNISNIVAIITGDNKRSLAFHKKLGYEYVGTFKDVGYKFGQWHDVTWFKKTLIKPKENMPKVISYLDVSK